VTASARSLPPRTSGSTLGKAAKIMSTVPADVQERLATAVRQTVGDAAVAESLAKQGAEPLTNTPAEFRQHLQAEIARWAGVVKFANVKVD